MLRKLLSSVAARMYSRAAGSCFLLFAAAVCVTPRVEAAELNVGPARSLKSLQAAVSAAKPNDRIVLDAGVYVDEVATIDKPLTIEGAGRGATFRITKPISNRKGILVVNADLTIRKITFEGALVTDADGKNGAGIRHQTGDLVVDTCVFRNNQNGILANGNKDATVTIRRSAFIGNGAGDGYTHGIYINAVARLTVTGSTFAGTKVGHNIKSRALKTTIADTILDDGVTGSASYAIDLPNGGEVVLKGVRITQGQRTSNTAMVAYGAEKNLHEGSSLTITDSAFVNRAKNSTAVNNFTAIPGTLRDNTFENVGEVAKGLMQMDKSAAPAVGAGAVFSGIDPNARSYLRLHNTGTAYGHVGVRVYDSRDGRFLGTWTSPNIAPNAAPQFSITTLEDALHVQDRPATYTIAFDPAMVGTFQHVLHRPGNGVISNLSTCSAGTAAAGAHLANVHTSNLDRDYPASIVVRNTGALPATAQIGVYDARDGTRVGFYTTPEVPVDGEVIVPVAALEAGAKAVPTWDMGHWVLTIENDFPGTFQQLVANVGAGVITDMTAVCALSGAVTAAAQIVTMGSVFPPSPDLEAMLQVHNTGLAAASVRMTIYDAGTGSRIGTWESPSIAPHASRQFAVPSLLPPSTADQAAPRFYRVSIEGGLSGLVQHLLRHHGRGTVTNLSACDSGTTASVTAMAGLRPSSSPSEEVDLLVVHNAGAVAMPARIDVFESLEGLPLGSFATLPVPGGGNVALSVVDVENGLGLPPNSGVGGYNLELAEGFPGSIQRLAVSTQTGTVTDMTTACAVKPVNG